MKFWISRLPEYCIKEDYLRLGIDPISLYIDVGPVGVQCFYIGMGCLLLAVATWALNRR